VGEREGEATVCVGCGCAEIGEEEGIECREACRKPRGWGLCGWYREGGGVIAVAFEFGKDYESRKIEYMTHSIA